MKMIIPAQVKEIDRVAIETLGISEETLIRRAGGAVADAVCEYLLASGGVSGRNVIIFCGPGNNGADGYAAGLVLAARGACVIAVDVFEKGQRSEGGNAVLAAYREQVDEPISLQELLRAQYRGVAVDAVFGTGLSAADLPEEGRIASRYMNRYCEMRFAIDVPFGVDALDGSVREEPLQADATVVLGFMKRGLLSYPARQFCGKLILNDIGLHVPAVEALLADADESPDDDYVRRHLPPRRRDSHKGTYGKVLMIAGSARYRGAAHLAALGALRSGVGLLKLCAEEPVLVAMGRKLPDVIYAAVPAMSSWDDTVLESVCQEAASADAVLIGPGCGMSDMLYRLVKTLLLREGAPLILDADAINVLAAHREEAEQLLQQKARAVILTPHPLEFARLLGVPIADVQANRIQRAAEFANRFGVTVVLKGACSVIASKGYISINTQGSSALSKGGSGDVLAGVAASLTAQGMGTHQALTVAAYLHGKAGESLATELSEYGVLSSDLPRQIAVEIAEIVKNKQE